MNKQNDDKNKYHDIMNIPYRKSQRHRPMNTMNRAAQFAPFSALNGHEEAIKETSRQTQERILIDENQKELIDRKLQYILSQIKNHPQISITYFKDDLKKDGGSYIIINDTVQKIDTYHHVLILSQGLQIPIQDIYDIHIEE